MPSVEIEEVVESVVVEDGTEVNVSGEGFNIVVEGDTTVVVQETEIEVVEVASSGGGGGGGTANVTFQATFTQSSLIGQPVCILGAGSVGLARANSASTFRVVGLATAAVDTGLIGSVQVAGVLTASTAQWDAVAGTSGGLTPGAVYWLSPSSPGGITSTAPVTLGQYLVSIGEALSSTSLLINFNGWPVLL